MFGEALLLEGLVALATPQAGAVPHPLLRLGEPALRDSNPAAHAHRLLRARLLLLTVQHSSFGPLRRGGGGGGLLGFCVVESGFASWVWGCSLLSGLGVSVFFGFWVSFCLFWGLLSGSGLAFSVMCGFCVVSFGFALSFGVVVFFVVWVLLGLVWVRFLGVGLPFSIVFGFLWLFGVSSRAPKDYFFL